MEEPVAKRAFFETSNGTDLERKSDESVKLENTSFTDENRKQPNARSRVGFAAVKPEYLVDQVKRTLRTGFVAAADRQSLAENSEQVEQRGVSESLGGEQQNGPQDDDKEGKKTKLRGRNQPKQRFGKNRPGKKPDSIRVCYQISQSETCNFGGQCRYSHDIAGYLAQKPKDLDGVCPVFEKFGYCTYGITCRFAHQHLDADNKNIKREASTTLHAVEQNWIDEAEKQKFRKKQFQFPISSRVVKEMNDRIYRSKKSSDDEIGAEVLHRERGDVKKMDVRDKLYLAPLTTVGNLPFRRLCVELGADITCGEMAMSMPLLQGNKFEWSHVRRHKSEKYFGVQICGNKAETLARTTELLDTVCENVDFIDLNCGCPIDMVYNSGCGSALLSKPNRLYQIVYAMSNVATVPVSVKLRTGVHDGKNNAHSLLTSIYDAGASCIAVHGRTREQRYSKLADWSYIRQCSDVVQSYISEPDSKFSFIGNGDVLSYEDFYQQLELTKASNILIARGALVKPWIFTEIKERRHWDISSSERLDILKKFANYGLEHWGSDERGVENTRRFLLEWLSFTHRYIPVGLLERVPQKINEVKPFFCGRDDMETLMASSFCEDWIKISEMLLGKVPDEFAFLPKHKANAYQVVPMERDTSATTAALSDGMNAETKAETENGGADTEDGDDDFMPQG